MVSLQQPFHMKELGQVSAPGHAGIVEVNQIVFLPAISRIIPDHIMQPDTVSS
jgi:hypothetical protein